MADAKALHMKAVRDLEGQYGLVMDKSADGVYIYLDDEHKACNEKLARLFGYSKEEWERTSPFLDNFVAPRARNPYPMATGGISGRPGSPGTWSS